MIRDIDQQRIVNECNEMMDRLMSIRTVASEGRLHERYLAEKLATINHCADWLNKIKAEYGM